MFRKKLRTVSAVLLCVLCVFLSIVPASAAGGNLIRNPGFEEKNAAWMTGPSTNLYFAPLFPSDPDQEPYEGDWSAWPECTSPTGEALLYQDVLITEPGSYELSAAVLHRNYSTDGSNDVSMRIQTPDGMESVHTSSDHDGQWQYLHLQIDIKAPVRATVSFQINGVGNFMVDAVSLVMESNLNLIKNPGFETNMDFWTSYGDPCAYLTDAESHAGKQAVYMGYYVNEGLRNYIEQEQAVSGTGTYLFTVWIKTAPSLKGAGAILFLDARDDQGRVLATESSTAINNTDGQWTQMSVSITAPQGTTTIAAKIAGIYCTGAFYVDDASLTIQS